MGCEPLPPIHLFSFKPINMAKYFDQSELSQIVADRAGITTEQAADILEIAFGAIAQGIALQGKAGFKDFGSLTLKRRKQRTHKLSGEEHTIPEHYDIKFNPNDKFVFWVNEMLPGDVKVREV